MANQSASPSRRAVLRLIVGAAAACPICAGLAGMARAAEHAAHGGAAPHWGYEGDAGPEHWGELSPDFKTCSIGLQQTPIDISDAIRAELGAVEVAFKPVPLKILNTGHTIQVNCELGSRCTVDGTIYDLVQFHFHHPSEHLLSGKAFDMECHFVHKAASGALAVLGVFIRPGGRNAALQPIWNAMPREESPVREAGGTVDPAALLPTGRAYYRYFGSLTTPPCSEGITWTVFKDPIEASADQIRRFGELFPNNARPVQPRNWRFLLEPL